MFQFIRRVGYAVKGIAVAVKEERNLKIQVLLAMGVIVLGFILGITLLEWVVVIFCIGFVLVSELINTALENLIDAISPTQIPWAGKVKDIAAGAVLIASLISVIIAALIFVPYFIQWITG